MERGSNTPISMILRLSGVNMSQEPNQISNEMTWALWGLAYLLFFEPFNLHFTITYGNLEQLQ